MGYKEDIVCTYDEDDDVYFVKVPYDEDFNRDLGLSRAVEVVEFDDEEKHWVIEASDEGTRRLEQLFSKHFPFKKVKWL